MPKYKRNKPKKQLNLRDRISAKLFKRPYSWLDAAEAQEVRDYIKTISKQVIAEYELKK